MTSPLIIIGAGLAGWTTAREFRKQDTTTPVMVITADSGDFYAKPSLSNAFAQQRSPAQLITTAAASMAQTLNVTLLAHTRVNAIHPQSHTLSTSAGDFAYRQLVLANGAQAIRVPVAGDAADQVQSINSLDDFERFYTQLDPQPAASVATEPRRRKHIMIMGGGLIGCEFANDLTQAGYQVSVADPAAGPIAALLPAQVSAELRDALTGLGVHWHLGSSVKSVTRRAQVATDAHAPALQVELANGHLAPVDHVLSAIGLRADTALAQEAGLQCERGVRVDATLQTSAADIYALGDCAQYAPGRWDTAGSTLPQGRTLPYVMPIMNAAKALAVTLTGQPTELVFPLMPVAIKTPALPIVVAAPAPGTPGNWHPVEAGVWHFVGSDGKPSGFLLTGPQTRRRAEQAKLLAT